MSGWDLTKRKPERSWLSIGSLLFLFTGLFRRIKARAKMMAKKLAALMAKTGAGPENVKSEPAIAGPIIRATLNIEELSAIAFRTS